LRTVLQVKCPSCSRDTISFWEWGFRLNAFVWSCPHCSAKLKAKAATWVSFALGMGLMMAWTIGLGVLASTAGVDDDWWILPVFFAGIPVAIFPAAWLGYRYGGYVVRQKK
jgi:hypothetical protein